MDRFVHDRGLKGRKARGARACTWRRWMSSRQALAHWVIAAAFAALATDVSAQTCDLALNGSFEAPNIQTTPTPPGQQTATVNGFAVWRNGLTSFDGWQVTAGSVDFLRHFSNASDGAQSIDLWGKAPSTIQQTFIGLIPGATYSFSVDYSGLSVTQSIANLLLDNGAGFQLVQALAPIANGVGNGNGGVPNTPQYTVRWATFTHNFVAVGTQVTIRFANRTAPATLNTGLFIDNFSFSVQAPCPIDLAVTKTDNNATYTPGADVTYAVVVANNGPAPVTGAPITDPLPAGITTASWTCTAAGGGACGAASGSGALATTADLPSGATVTYLVTLTVPSTATGPLSNTATVIVPAGFSDTNPANNSAQDVDTIAPTADLVINKRSTPNPYVPGAPFSYTIIASNNGPSVANAALINDALPAALAGFGWTCTGSSGATCPASGTGSLVNVTVNLPVGGLVTFLVSGTLSPGTTGLLTNTATVAPPAGTTDPVPANNTATDVNPAGAIADLSITKASTPNPYVPGQPLTYTVVVTNHGPGDVLGARLRDPLPAAFATFAWTCVAGPGAACLTTSGSGDIDVLVDLPAGTNATFTSTGTVPPAFTGTATNTATITPPATLNDPVPGNNSATIQNPPGPLADLAITKTQTPDPYVPGMPLTYTLIVTNLGSSDAPNARVQDVPPGGLTNVAWTCAASGTGASCGTAAGANVIDTLVTLPAGASATFTMTADVAPSQAGPLTNTATVTAPPTVSDSVPGNNTATVTSGASQMADLSIVKTASMNPYVPGAPLAFTIVVRNAGPSDVVYARVQDLFPAALSGFTWSCAPSAGVATCGTASGASVIDTLVDLAAGGAVTFTVTGSVPADATGPLTNTATVAVPADTRDPNPGNNSSAVTLSNGALADLSVTKTSTPNPYVPGAPLTFTVVFANAGPSAVFAARVQDVVPAAVHNVNWSCVAGNGSCPAASGAGSLDATVDIGAGGTVTFTFTGTVTPQANGVLTNTAAIVPPPGVVDPDASDNAAVHANPALPNTGGPADLQITQEHPGVAPPDGLLTFRLRTRNLGSNSALNPYVTGMIPPGTTFVSATPGAGGTCNVPDNPAAPDPATGYPVAGAAAVEPLRCTWPGVMAVGESHVVEFTVRVAPTTPSGQILWSCFWTWSDTLDPYHANNVVDGYLFVDDGLSPVGDLAVSAAALSEGVIGTPLAARAGESLPIRFWVTNHGPAASRGQYALILDTADTISILDVSLAQGWISPSGPASATWDTGQVQPGQTVAVDLRVRLLTTTSVKLFAQRVAGRPADPDASNDHAEIVLDGYGPGLSGRWVAVGNVDGADAGEMVTGAGEGETPQVRVFNGNGTDTNTRFFAYERPFLGGVRIASCDVDGDGIDELITAPGPGRASTIRVLRLAGAVVTELIAFDAFEPGFTGGAYIACADLDADGRAEVVVGAGPGRAPEVQVYSVGLSTVVPVATFLAYESGFRGGVRVAAGPYAGRAGWLDAFAIATTPGSGRPAELRLWTGGGAPVAQVLVSGGTDGVLPTLGDVNGDGAIDLIVAPDRGRPELVRIFDVDTGMLIGEVPGGLPDFHVGVRLALGLLTGGPGAPEIVVGNGPGGHPRVRVIYWPPSGPVQRLEVLPLEIP